MLVSTATDALGGQQAAFTNGSGLTVKTEQYAGPNGTITTSFEFDAVNQLLKIIDNAGNETLSTYDPTGRRTLQEDATGAQEFFYGRLDNVNKIRCTVIIPNQAIATDTVDNVLSVVITASLPTTGMGGQMVHNYTCDGLYRKAC